MENPGEGRLGNGKQWGREVGSRARVVLGTLSVDMRSVVYLPLSLGQGQAWRPGSGPIGIPSEPFHHASNPPGPSKSLRVLMPCESCEQPLTPSHKA